MKPCQQCARVGFHMCVVLGDELKQQPHLLLLHCLDEEAVVIRQEEGTSRLARRSQQPQSPVSATEARQLVIIKQDQTLPELSRRIRHQNCSVVV